MTFTSFVHTVGYYPYFIGPLVGVMLGMAAGSYVDKQASKNGPSASDGSAGGVVVLSVALSAIIFIVVGWLICQRIAGPSEEDLRADAEMKAKSAQNYALDTAASVRDLQLASRCVVDELARTSQPGALVSNSALKKATTDCADKQRNDPTQLIQAQQEALKR